MAGSLGSFRQGLQERDGIVGRTIEIEHRVGPDDNEFWRRSGGRADRAGTGCHRGRWKLPADAAAAGDAPGACRVRECQRPVGAGFVASLARPEGNATGLTMYRIWHEREMAGSCSSRSRPG